MNHQKILNIWIFLKYKLHQIYSDPGILFLAIVFFGLTLPFIFSGNRAYDSDHIRYHLPSILQIRKNLPILDISKDTLSAIAPGYYYFLATISFLTGSDEQTLRIINCIISFLIPLSLYIYARKSLSVKSGCLLVLPLVTSNFFIKSSWWIFTDNAALLLVLWTVIAILEVRNNSQQGIKIGILSSITTFVRQLHVWLVIPSLLRVLLPNNQDSISLKNLKPLFPVNKVNFISLVAALQPGLIIAILYFSWGGLVPPVWKEASLKISLSPVAYILAVWGFLGVFYLGSIRKNIKDYWNNKFVIISFFLGFIVSLISPTTFSVENGRWGGYFWEIVKRLPQIFDRSIFFIILTPLGAAVIGIFYLKMRQLEQRNESLLWISSVASWAVTFVINRQVFHRYYEPMILVFLILVTCSIWKEISANSCQRIHRFLMVLIIFQTTTTLILSK